MLVLVLVLLSAGAICSVKWEYLNPQQLLWSKFGVACVPAWIAGGWAPESPPRMTPSSLQPITAWCGQHTLLVLAKLDLLRMEHPVQALELMLGPAGCPSVWMDTQTNTAFFHSDLSDCGIAVMVFVHQLVYSTHLYYMPRAAGSAIVRSKLDVAYIECHYPRKVIVDRQTGTTWLPLSALQTKEELTQYSLRLMSGDWHVERTSNIYQLGDFIHIEASVTISCVPMRLYVDSCVATSSPDKDSTPRHQLIGFNGCLLDSRPTGSSSSFVSPRAHLNKLQIKLDVLRFLDVHSSIFITCRLKVAAIDKKPDSVNKACMFQKPANQWIPVEGHVGICVCCDLGNCRGGRRRRSTGFSWKAIAAQFEDEQLQKEGEVQIGPLEILPARLRDPVPRVQLESQNISHREEAPRHSEVNSKTLTLVVLAGVVALLLSGLVVGGVVICGALTIFSLYNKLAKPSI